MIRNMACDQISRIFEFPGTALISDIGVSGRLESWRDNDHLNVLRANQILLPLIVFKYDHAIVEDDTD